LRHSRHRWPWIQGAERRMRAGRERVATVARAVCWMCARMTLHKPALLRVVPRSNRNRRGTPHPYTDTLSVRVVGAWRAVASRTRTLRTSSCAWVSSIRTVLWTLWRRRTTGYPVVSR